MSFVAIDFEASCLPRHGRSFPIEVAISGPEGTRSWLIKPHSSWHGWDWTDEAFELHGITRKVLEDHGVEPAIVVEELTRAVAGRRVFADSSIDATWWATLCEAASILPLIRVQHASLLLGEMQASGSEIAAAKRFADQHCSARHRAAPDAEWLWCLLSELERCVAGRTSFRDAA